MQLFPAMWYENVAKQMNKSMQIFQCQEPNNMRMIPSQLTKLRTRDLCLKYYMERWSGAVNLKILYAAAWEESKQTSPIIYCQIAITTNLTNQLFSI